MLNEPGDAQRRITIRLALGFCRKLGLKGSRGDIEILARKIGIGRNFAAKILHASLDGTENELFSKKRKSSSFHGTDWPAKYKEFVFRPEYAHPVPG